MGKDEYLLYKQSIKGNKKIGKDELTTLFKKKPNRRILGTLPYLYAYYVGKSKLDTAKYHRQREDLLKKYAEKVKKVDTTDAAKNKKKNVKKVLAIREKRDKRIDKIDLKLNKGNWLMRVVGEPPSLYDTANTNYNKKQIDYYLNSKGYFLNYVEVKIDTAGKKVSETYKIQENDPYKIKTIEYAINDTAIKNIVNQNLKNAAVDIGKNYEESKLSEERDRINKLLKENGYYDFTTQYIVIDIDSSIGNREMDVRIVVRNPPSKDMHPRYKINKIIFNSDVTRSRQEKWDTTFFQGIYYIYKKDNFSKKILNKKIRIQKGEYFAQSRIQLTQRQLAALDMYKFININFDKSVGDTLVDSLKNLLTANIRTSPLQKFQTTEEGGLNISSAGFIPGPFGSLNFKSRNTFRGFEVFETTLRASVIGQAAVLDPTQNYISKELNGDLSLTFPQFFFPTNIRFRMEDFSPKTKFIAGYTLVSRPEYVRTNLKTSMNYLFSPNGFTQYNIALFDINYISTPPTYLSTAFRNYLDSLNLKGNPLRNSFRNSIVTDINGTYTYNDNVAGSNRRSKFFKLYLESGGLLWDFYNKLPGLKNKFLGDTLLVRDNRTFSVKDSTNSLNIYKYFKINTDLRYYFPVNKNTFVFRINLGAVYPYGKQFILPYEKYFFMGGSNSMRAWPTRRLGPGSYIARENGVIIKDKYGNPRYQFEQPGQITIETNLEYRFKIVSFFEGALFTDIGNLWNFTNKRDTTKREGEFRANRFLTQLAVGTGAGLRLNFSFLILRLDLGFKTIDPAAEGNKFVFFQPNVISHPRLNIGIGYPF